MKINWKVRFKNGTFVLTFAALVLSFVYNVLGMLEVVPPISEDAAVSVVAGVVQVLAALGIVTDPTTKGVKDSERAMTYTKPR